MSERKETAISLELQRLAAMHGGELLPRVMVDAARDEEFFRVNALLLRNPSLVNMLDGCAISIPCHAPGELPAGLMIWQGAMHDDAVLNIALQAQAALARTTGNS